MAKKNKPTSNNFLRIGMLGLNPNDLKFLTSLLSVDKKRLLELELTIKGPLNDIFRIAITLIFFAIIIFGFPSFLALDFEKWVAIVGIGGFLLSTAPGVFLQKEKIEAMDKSILDFSYSYKEYLKYSIIKLFLISNVSTKQIKYDHVLKGNAAMILTSILIAFFYVYSPYGPNLSSDTDLNFFEDLLVAPSAITFLDPKVLIVKLAIMVIIVSSMKSPSFDEELANKNKLQSLYKGNRYLNGVLTAVGFILLGFPIVMGMIEFDMGFFEILTLNTSYLIFILFLGYIYLQAFLGIELHGFNTLSSLKDEKKQFWILEILLLSPYYLFTGLLFHFIPTAIFLFFSWLVSSYFKLCIITFKIPSPLRLIGFIITLTIAIHKFILI